MTINEEFREWVMFRCVLSDPALFELSMRVQEPKAENILKYIGQARRLSLWRHWLYNVKGANPKGNGTW